jgi:hypothetical protein
MIRVIKRAERVTPIGISRDEDRMRGTGINHFTRSVGLKSQN